MTDLDIANLKSLLNMEQYGLITSDDAFSQIIDPAWWSVPVCPLIRHGKKR